MTQKWLTAGDLAIDQGVEPAAVHEALELTGLGASKVHARAGADGSEFSPGAQTLLRAEVSGAASALRQRQISKQAEVSARIEAARPPEILTQARLLDITKEAVLSGVDVVRIEFARRHKFSRKATARLPMHTSEGRRWGPASSSDKDPDVVSEALGYYAGYWRTIDLRVWLVARGLWR